MARQQNKLTNKFCEKVAFVPDGKNRHGDGGSLFLLVTPTAKRWQMDYRRPVTNKENTLSFGLYPVVSLEQARQKRHEARALLTQGIDPAEVRSQKKKQAKQEQSPTFATVAAQWIEQRKANGVSIHENERRLTTDALPVIGHLALTEVTPELLEKKLFAPIVARDAKSVAQRLRSDLRGIFKLARKQGLMTDDPTQDVFLPRHKGGHFAALITPAEVRRLAIALWRPDQRSAPSVVNAAQLGMLVFLRPYDLRFLRWSQVDLIGDEWGPMLALQTQKRDDPLLVPLPRQAVAILERQKDHAAHDGVYVFPAQRRNTRDPVLSEGTIRNYLIAHGFAGEQTHHGMRATAKTLLVERLKADDRHVEMQLTHTVKDHLGQSYNRAKWLEDRRGMLQAWADYLDHLRDDQVIPFKKPASA